MSKQNWEKEFDEMFDAITKPNAKLIWNGYGYLTVHGCIKHFIAKTLSNQREQFAEKMKKIIGKNEQVEYYAGEAAPQFNRDAEVRNKLRQQQRQVLEELKVKLSKQKLEGEGE